jgi:hypothetical protein
MDTSDPILDTPPVTKPKNKGGRPPKPKPIQPPPPAPVSTGGPVVPRVSVLEKRLSGGNPFGIESVPIPLKESGWVTYIANGGRSDGRLYQMKAVKGWEPVLVSDCAVKPEDIGFRHSPEGYLCRGEKGQEVVFKMRQADFTRLQQAKTAQNLKGIGSSAKTKASIAEAATAQFGDEAGQFVNEHFVGEVRDWRAPEDL